MKSLTLLKLNMGFAVLCLTAAIAAPAMAQTSQTSDDAKTCATIAGFARAMASERDDGESEPQVLHEVSSAGLGESIQHSARIMADRVFGDWDSWEPQRIEQQVYDNCMQP